MTRHADLMDAHAYWRQFPVRIYWDTPKTVVGTVVRLDEQRAKDGALPVVVLQLDDGTVAEILVTQARLTAELVAKEPAVGDRVKIDYTGEAARAAPGMSPTKEFTVVVRRKGSQSGAGAGPSSSVRGSAAAEGSVNEPRTGSKGT